MVFEAFTKALMHFGDPSFLLSMFTGTVTGLIFGVIPGIGGLTAMALFLPFVFMMTPEQALPFMLSAHSVSSTGGSITAILMDIPGTGPNAATLIDGFPMSQKGEASRALGAGLMSSAAGGVLSVVLAFGMVYLILPFIFAIRSADMVFIIVMGFAFIAVLGKGAMIKGLVSGGLGILISLIGYHASTGTPRFTLGIVSLNDGIKLIPIILGLFALPELINLIGRGGTIAERERTVKGISAVLKGAKETFIHWKLALRSSTIGFIVGALPGIGGEVSSFVAYGQAKQTSRHPERFGTGIVEGVIAPESANNAKEGGMLLTTMALGIPGSAGGALLLGALMMLGILPGPTMMSNNLDLVITLLLVIVVANVIGAAIGFVTAPHMAKLCTVPARFLVPSVLVFIYIGAFAFREQLDDLVVLMICGALGLAMARFGFNRPALLLGYVLGDLFEKYLLIALKLSGVLFFVRPISLTLIFIIIAVFGLKPVRRWLGRRKGLKSA